MMKQLLSVFVFLMMCASAKAAIWTEENQWSEDYEKQYKEWVRTNAKVNFFSAEKKPNGEPNPYYGIRVDCADLVYSYRIIFAYENKLPFVIANPASPRGPLISNQVSRFDKVAEGIPRLRRFLVWVYDIVGTSSLNLDTYSIPFKEIGSGTIILTSKKNHHSWTIVDISKTGNPHLIYNSTVGRESGFQVQERQSWPNPFWVFEPEVARDDETKTINVYKSGSYAGFRYWRPTEFLKQPEISVPGFSDEQHTVGLGKWKTAAQSSHAKVKETIDQVVMRLLKDACADYKQRVESVRDAETFKSNLADDLAAGKTEEQSSYVRDFMRDENKPSDQRCMTYGKFDEFSTPSRDKRFVDALMLARTYLREGITKYGEKAFAAENMKMYKTIFPLISLSAADEVAKDKTEKASNLFCSLKINDTLGELSLPEVKRRLFLGRLSSNPNDAPTRRFGYPKTSKDLGSSCPAYDFQQKPYNLQEIEQEMLKEVKTAL